MLKAFDQVTNVVLDECHERVYSLDAGVTTLPLGVYILRGDNVYVLAMLLMCALTVLLPPSFPPPRCLASITHTLSCYWTTSRTGP